MGDSFDPDDGGSEEPLIQEPDLDGVLSYVPPELLEPTAEHPLSPPESASPAEHPLSPPESASPAEHPLSSPESTSPAEPAAGQQETPQTVLNVFNTQCVFYLHK